MHSSTDLYQNLAHKFGITSNNPPVNLINPAPGHFSLGFFIVVKQSRCGSTEEENVFLDLLLDFLAEKRGLHSVPVLLLKSS